MAAASGVRVLLERADLERLLSPVDGRAVAGLIAGRPGSPVTADQLRRYLDDWTRDSVLIEVPDSNHLRLSFPSSGWWIVVSRESPLYLRLDRAVAELWGRRDDTTNRKPFKPHDERQIADFFGEESILVFEREDAYQRLIEGDSVAVEEAFDDDEGDGDQEGAGGVLDGVYLVTTAKGMRLPTNPAPWSWRDAIPAVEVDRYVRKVVEGFVLAECRDQRVARCGSTSLRKLLVEKSEDLEASVPTVPMEVLETWTNEKSAHPFSSPDERMQYPNAYRTIYKEGSYRGILNRSVDSEVYASDYMWIEKDLCLFWMRSNTFTPQWIRLLSFRVDRSGPSGRLLRRWRHWTFLERLLLPRRVSRDWCRYYWYR